MSETTSLPILPPPTPVKVEPHATITEKEQELYDGVLKHFSQEGYKLPGEENGDLLEEEKIWLSRECFLR
jgi:hypothetical protein